MYGFRWVKKVHQTAETVLQIHRYLTTGYTQMRRQYDARIEGRDNIIRYLEVLDEMKSALIREYVPEEEKTKLAELVVKAEAKYLGGETLAKAGE